MRSKATAVTVAALALALSATFTSSAVAVPNVVDQYTEQVPSPTGPALTGPGRPGGQQRPDDRQNSGPTAGSGSDTALPDWLSAIGAPVPAGADLTALREGGEDSGQGPAGGLDPGAGQAIEPSGLPGAEPAPNTEFAPQTEAGGIGSSMGIVFPAILLLVTAAAVASLFVRRGARSRAGQD